MRNQGTIQSDFVCLYKYAGDGSLMKQKFIIISLGMNPKKQGITSKGGEEKISRLTIGVRPCLLYLNL